MSNEMLSRLFYLYLFWGFVLFLVGYFSIAYWHIEGGKKGRLAAVAGITCAVTIFLMLAHRSWAWLVLGI